MSTARRDDSRPAPEFHGKPSRGYHWITPPTERFPYGVLNLTVKGESNAYFVQPIPSDFGRAFVVTKIDGIGKTVYHVLLDGKTSTCDCKGFEQHRHCKHRDALVALLAAGELPMPAAPSR